MGPPTNDSPWLLVDDSDGFRPRKTNGCCYC